MPPELKQFDDALPKSGLNEITTSSSLPSLSSAPRPTAEQPRPPSASPRASSPVQDILANFRKQKVKPTSLRTNQIYPMGKTGMVLCLRRPVHHDFRTSDAVKAAWMRAMA